MSERLAKAAARRAAGTAEPAGNGVTDSVGEAIGSDPPVVIDDGREPDDVPVHTAWSRVMRDVREIGKGQQYAQGNTRYRFRGVDDVINAFGPVCRMRGVIVAPARVTLTTTAETTKQGGHAERIRAVVEWSVIGPRGDLLPTPLSSAGESLDTSDKGTAKAQSVALRVLLLQLGLVPTDNPDPDSMMIEVGRPRVASLLEYRNEVLDPATTRDRFVQIRHEVNRHYGLASIVPNENEADEEFGRFLDRIGLTRFAKSRQADPPAPKPPTGDEPHDFVRGANGEECAVPGCGLWEHADIHQP